MKRSYDNNLKRKARGQTNCGNDDCDKIYNNASIPHFCTCGYELGGTFVSTARSRSKPDDTRIFLNLASVRKNAQGIGTRIFVDTVENKVSDQNIFLMSLP